MSAPQSGDDELGGQLEEAGPEPFEHRSVSPGRVGAQAARSLVRGSGDEDVGHDRHRDPEDEQHRGAGRDVVR